MKEKPKFKTLSTLISYLCRLCGKKVVYSCGEYIVVDEDEAVEYANEIDKRIDEDE